MYICPSEYMYEVRYNRYTERSKLVKYWGEVIKYDMIYFYISKIKLRYEGVDITY